MKLIVKALLVMAVAATLFSSAHADDCSDYNSGAVYDGHLTVHDAFSHYWCGEGVAVTVDASRLTVQQVGDWDANGWAKGVVQGLGSDFLVHGRVGLFNTNGVVSIQQEPFNFEQRTDASMVREIEVILGRTVVGNGMPYLINFQGQPILVTNGNTYYQ